MLNYLFVGVGQCGNKIANIFASFGNKAIAVNTTDKDMTCLEHMEKSNMLNIAATGTNGGAGKTPILGQKAMKEHLSEVREKIDAVNADTDYVVLCGGLGGGTGSGGIPILLHSLVTDKKKVMLILTLPDDSEGVEVQVNAFNSLISILKTIDDKNIPYILIDNNKIKAKMSSTDDFDWRSVNVHLAKIFSQFNKAANKNSPYQTFDETDYKKTMYTPGMLALVKSRFEPEKFTTENSLLDAVKKEWQKGNFYIDFEPQTARMMTTIIEAPEEFLSNKDNYKLLDAALLKLRNACGTVSHYGGIYPYSTQKDPNKNGTIVVYCMLTGLKTPVERIETLQARANEAQEAMQRKAMDNQVDLEGFGRISAVSLPKKSNPAAPVALPDVGDDYELDFL